MELDDDGSQGSDKPITVVESSTGKVLRGDDAPMLSQLQQWLEMHPGWEVADSDSDSDDDDGKFENEKKLILLVNVIGQVLEKVITISG